MKRHIVAALSILGLAAGVGWQLASHQESSVGLQEISLNQSSEHSQASATDALGRIRVRVMANDSNEITAQVPQISLAE